MQISEYHRMAQVSTKHWWYLAKRSLLTNLLNFWLPDLKSPRKILDVGSGTGANWPVLRHFGTVVGLEQSEIGVAYCQSLGWSGIKQGNANEINFPAASFDLVTILDVLYHKKIKSDQKVLNTLARIIKPGGWLVVTDCAGPAWYGPHDKVNQARQRYTLAEMTGKVSTAGLEVKHASYFYFLSYPLFAVTRLAQKFNFIGIENSENLPPTIVNWCLTKLLMLESKLACRLKLPIGSSILVLAQKSI